MAVRRRARPGFTRPESRRRFPREARTPSAAKPSAGGRRRVCARKAGIAHGFLGYLRLALEEARRARGPFFRTCRQKAAERLETRPKPSLRLTGFGRLQAQDVFPPSLSRRRLQRLAGLQFPCRGVLRLKRPASADAAQNPAASAADFAAGASCPRRNVSPRSIACLPTELGEGRAGETAGSRAAAVTLRGQALADSREDRPGPGGLRPPGRTSLKAASLPEGQGGDSVRPPLGGRRGAAFSRAAGNAWQIIAENGLNDSPPALRGSGGRAGSGAAGTG
jgi:hypothetical protein